MSHLLKLKSILLILPLMMIIIGLSACSTESVEKAEQKKSVESKTPPKITEEQTQVTESQIKDLEADYSKNPSVYSKVYELAKAYQRTGKSKEALALLDKYVTDKAGPDIERAAIDKCLILAEMGQTEEAYQALLKQSQNEKNSLRSEIFFQLGNIVATGVYLPEGADKVALAVDYFERALDSGETDPLLYRRLADLMYAEKKMEEAREYLAIYLVVYPYDGSSWLDLGDWSVEAGDKERALEYYKKALDDKDTEIRERAQKSIDSIK